MLITLLKFVHLDAAFKLGHVLITRCICSALNTASC